MRLIDRLIYGSGRGLRMPLFDQRIYWLVDRNTQRGDFYTWSGWFGSQIQSFQWRIPKSREERVLSGVRFRLFGWTKTWGRVRVSWCIEGLDAQNIETANKWLHALEQRLGQSVVGDWPPETVAEKP